MCTTSLVLAIGFAISSAINMFLFNKISKLKKTNKKNKSDLSTIESVEITVYEDK